jgi:hypothetical protein
VRARTRGWRLGRTASRRKTAAREERERAQTGDPPQPPPSPLAGHPVAYFRGRKLSGAVHALPKGVTGVVMREVAIETPVKGSADASAAGGAGAGAAGGRLSREAALAALEAEDDDDDEGGGGGGGMFGGFGDDDGGAGIMFDEDGNLIDEMEDGGRGGKEGGGGSGAGDGAGKGGHASAAAGSSTAATSVARAFVVDSTFTSVTVWVHDRPATDADMVPTAVEWMEVARVLHG